MTALHAASKETRLKTVQWLLAKGADVQACDSEVCSAFISLQDLSQASNAA